MKRELGVWMFWRTRIAQRRSLLVEILRYPQNDDAKCRSENIFSGTSEIRGRRRLTNCFGGHSWSWQRWSDNNRAERRAARNGNPAPRRSRLQHAWKFYNPRRLLPPLRRRRARRRVKLARTARACVSLRTTAAKICNGAPRDTKPGSTSFPRWERRSPSAR